MNVSKELRRSLLIALSFVILTFPIMVIRVNTITDTIEWEWSRIILVGVGSFLVSFGWRFVQARKETQSRRKAEPGANMHPESDLGNQTPLDRILSRLGLTRETFRDPRIAVPVSVVIVGLGQ